MIEMTCHSAIRDKTRAINQFKALPITAPAGLRVSMNSRSFHRQVDRARRFSDRHDDLVERDDRRTQPYVQRIINPPLDLPIGPSLRTR
ncbi:MAG: hypothetical protein ACKVIY_07810 [Acidimicrobiales bacterium]